MRSISGLGGAAAAGRGVGGATGGGCATSEGVALRLECVEVLWLSRG